MKICCVGGGSVNDVWQERLAVADGADVVIFGFNGLGLVSYKKELAGETEYFQDVAKLSGQLGAVVICGCDTDTYGVFRHSAVVADRGRILGVTDMVNSLDESEYASGGSYKVYETGAGKIGVIIGEDLFFPETARLLSLCDAELIACVYPKSEDLMPQVCARAQAFMFGVVFALCGGEYSAVTDAFGNVKASGSGNVLKCAVSVEKEYRKITTRRRGGVARSRFK